MRPMTDVIHWRITAGFPPEGVLESTSLIRLISSLVSFFQLSMCKDAIVLWIPPTIVTIVRFEQLKNIPAPIISYINGMVMRLTGQTSNAPSPTVSSPSGNSKSVNLQQCSNARIPMVSTEGIVMFLNEEQLKNARGPFISNLSPNSTPVSLVQPKNASHSMTLTPSNFTRRLGEVCANARASILSIPSWNST